MGFKPVTSCLHIQYLLHTAILPRVNVGKVYICVSLETNNKFNLLVEQAVFEKNKVIEELQLLVKTAKEEKTELQTLLDEEKR